MRLDRCTRSLCASAPGGHQVAAVAGARKLTVLCWHLLTRVRIICGPPGAGRQIASHGLGISAAIGVTGLDTVFLDKPIKGWRPNHFIKDYYKPFVSKQSKPTNSPSNTKSPAARTGEKVRDGAECRYSCFGIVGDRSASGVGEGDVGGVVGATSVGGSDTVGVLGDKPGLVLGELLPPCPIPFSLGSTSMIECPTRAVSRFDG